EAHAVGNGLGLRRDFYGVHLTVPRDDDLARQIGHALKIVDREQNPRRHGIGAQKPLGQLTESFHLDIAPLASRVAGLSEPKKLTSDVPGELAASFLAAASGQERDICGPVLPEPT